MVNVHYLVHKSKCQLGGRHVREDVRFLQHREVVWPRPDAPRLRRSDDGCSCDSRTGRCRVPVRACLGW